MKYFFTNTGEYIGAFDEGSLNQVPTDAIEVSEPPNHGLDRLVNGQIVPYQITVPLPERLVNILDTAARSITNGIADGSIPAPPAGTFTSIAQLSATLKELARLVPVHLYAPEAYQAVTTLGELPEPLETVRQSILTTIQLESQNNQ